jgi:RNA polymerase sigma factor (sigma-70 family)
MTPERGSTSATLLSSLRDPNNEEAATRFYKRYAPRLIDLCKKSGLPDDATDDLTNDVIWRAIKGIRRGFRYNAHQNFSGWLIGIWQHAYADYCKSLARRRLEAPVGGEDNYKKLVAFPDDESVLQAVSPGIEQEVTEVALASVVTSLGRDGQIFVDGVLHEMSVPALAEKYSLSVAAVYTARSRARKELEGTLRELGYEQIARGPAKEKPIASNS